MLKWQRPDGRFHDILDDPETFPDGTSSAMMAAAVFRGIHGGFVPASRREAAEAALRAVEAHIDDMGLVREVCGCPDFLSEGTSAEAQAAYIMASAWMSRGDGSRPLKKSEHNQQPKTISVHPRKPSVPLKSTGFVV
jgi:hypothetical protein